MPRTPSAKQRRRRARVYPKGYEVAIAAASRKGRRTSRGVRELQAPYFSVRGPLKVAELFAGVGGFRLALEGAPNTRKSDLYRVVWSNQWEPSTRNQHASDIYVARFGPEGHCNKDIATVDVCKEIPDHDLLAGGFPCQDYSVAKPLNQAAGLAGKKGVLWWQIHRILSERGDKKPPILLLENVDRLLKSPASQRGRDFAVMLSSLSDLGYAVEWRIINAADYGFPQKRRRIFILAYHEELGDLGYLTDPIAWILKEGVLAKAFPVESHSFLDVPFSLDGDLADLSREFNKHGAKKSPFDNAGFMFRREYWTLRARPVYAGPRKTLGGVLQQPGIVPESFYIPQSTLPKWRYLKGAKDELRVDRKTGFKYSYTEGPIPFPDNVDQPSRTIVTGEGGTGPSRFKHVVKVEGRYRRLTPVELERLNMFPDNHTRGASDARRAFMMGNALVVGVVETIGKALAQRLRVFQPKALPAQKKVAKPAVFA